MVGDGDRRVSLLERRSNHLFRRIETVGTGCMEVQINRTG
jgi:hypothetical protein